MPPPRSQRGSTLDAVAVERLHQRERQLARAEEIAGLGSWEWDVAANEIRWSDQLYRIHGLDPGTRLGDPWECLERIHGEDRERLVGAFGEALAERRFSCTPARIVRADGDVRFIEVRGEVIVDDAGTVLRVVGTSRDVTEERRIVDALGESERRFRELVEHVSDVFWLIDSRSFDVLFVSAGYDRLFGRSPDYLFAQPATFLELVHPDDRERTTAAFWRRFAPEALSQEIEIEYRLLRPHGGARWIRSRSFPVRDEDGAITRVGGIEEDITERKGAEDAIRELSSRLLVLQDEERRRVSRELHDSTGANLIALAMSLARLKQHVQRSDGAARKILADAMELARQCVRDVRTVSYLLHPPMLDELGLPSALRWLVDGFAERSGVRAELDVDPDFGRALPAVEIHLFRVAQECLANVHRHSKSRVVHLRLAREAGSIRLEVENERRATRRGQKPPEPFPPRTGVGFAGMRERMGQLGGSLEITPTRKGTIVRAIAPVGAENGSELAAPRRVARSGARPRRVAAGARPAVPLTAARGRGNST